MIDIRKLKELVRLMVENDLSELDLNDKEETVKIKRNMTGAPMVGVAPAAYAPLPAPAAQAAPSAEPSSESSGASDEAGLTAVTSPMVGTFYTSANPDAPPFVTAGSSVGPDTTVCLIEAMKVFNEIKAEVTGTIERVLVENGKPVEYGQKLFLVRPA